MSTEKYIQTYEKDFHDIFEESLINSKVGALLFFALITLVYQIKYRKTYETHTFMGNKIRRMQVFKDAGFIAICAMLSVVYVSLSRGFSWGAMLQGVAIVGVILFSFDIAQESSGFNRWLDESQIIKGIGPYAAIDKMYRHRYQDESAQESDFNELNLEGAGDPFLDSLSDLSLLIVAFIVMWLVIKMVASTYWGYISGTTFVENTKFFAWATNGQGLNPNMGFTLELLVMGLINGLGPYMSPVFRQEQRNTMDYMMVGMFVTVSIVLHIMFQFTGLYGKSDGSVGSNEIAQTIAAAHSAVKID